MSVSNFQIVGMLPVRPTPAAPSVQTTPSPPPATPATTPSTPKAPTSSTAPQPDTTQLQAQITQLQKQLAAIRAQANALMSKLGAPSKPTAKPKPKPAHKPKPAVHAKPSTDRAKIYMQQPNGWSCAPTSLTMALAAWGVRPANQATLNEMIQLTGDNPNTGLPGNASLLADAARKVGMQAKFNPDGSPAAVRAALKAGHGVVLNGSLAPGSGHFIYVGGLNPDGSFKIFDPYRPSVTRMNASELNAFANTNSNPRGFAEIWK